MASEVSGNTRAKETIEFCPFFKGIIKARSHTNLQEVGCYPQSIFLEEAAYFTNATTKYIKPEYLQGREGAFFRSIQNSLVFGDYLMRPNDLYHYNMIVKEVMHGRLLYKLVYCTREVFTWLNPFEILVWVCILLFSILSLFSPMSNLKKFKVLYSIYFFVICCH